MEEINEIFKKASQAKKENKISLAIELIKTAKLRANTLGYVLSKDVDLKLAMYLQEIGENRESENLLINLFKKYLENTIELPAILDKIRLFYERNGEIEKAALFLITEALAYKLNQYLQWLRYDIKSFDNFAEQEEKYIKANTKNHPFLQKIAKLEKKHKIKLYDSKLENLFRDTFINFIKGIPQTNKEKSTQEYFFKIAKENLENKNYVDSFSKSFSKLFSDTIQSTIEKCEYILTKK